MLGLTKKKKITRVMLLSGTALLALTALPFSSHPIRANGVCGTATPNGAGGTDFVIASEENQTCHVDDDDNLTVQLPGSVVTIDEDAVVSVGAANTIINRGILWAHNSDDSNVAAIYVGDASINTIDNTNGVISASGDDADGIYVDDEDEGSGVIGQIINYGGVISAHDEDGNAILNYGTIGLIDNTKGAIVSLEDDAIDNDDEASVINTIKNTNGYIQAIESSAIENDGTIGTIDNTGGWISSEEGAGIYNEGAIGVIINVNGVIASVEGSALDLNGAITSGLILNTGGLIQTGTSESSSVYFGTNMGNLRIVGGTIRNAETENDKGRAVRIDADQTGIISFEGVSIVSHGPGASQGIAIIMDGGDGDEDADARVYLDANTIIRGRIIAEDHNHLDLATAADIQGHITFGNGDDGLFIFGGSIAGNIDFGTGDNHLQFGGSFTTGGTISTGVGGQTDMLLYPGANVVANHNIGLGSGDLLIAPDGTLYLAGGNLTTTGTFGNAGTIQIGVGRNLTVGHYETEGEGDFNGRMVFDTAGVSNAMTTGVINLGASAANLANQTIAVNYTGGLLTMPTRSLIVTGTGAATLPVTALEENSFFYDFGLVRDGGTSNEVWLVLTHVTTIEEAASTPNNARAAGIILGELNGNGDPVITEIQTRLHQSASREEFNQILESTQPTADNGNHTAAVAMTGAMFDLADGQLAMVNTDDEETGVASGNSLKGLHFWTQGFGGRADQGLRDGINGYDADIWGTAIGVDTRNFREDTVVGVSFGFADTGVDSRNANSTRTDVDSYQVMAYGNHKLEGNTFLTGMAVYGWNQNEQARFNVGGIPGLTAEADYDTWVGGFRGSIGRNFRYPGASMGARSFQLTPQLFSEYVHFSRDGYTETGAGGASLTVGEAEQDTLNLGVSLQAEWTYVVANGGKLKPDVHVSYRYDVLDGAADTTASFTAGGSTFGISGVDAADSTFGVGVGLKFYDASGWDFTANYDYTFKSDYQAHSGFLRAAYEF